MASAAHYVHMSSWHEQWQGQEVEKEFREIALFVFAAGLVSLFPSLNSSSILPFLGQVNFAPGYVVASRHMKAQVRRSKASDPVHTHSQDK